LIWSFECFVKNTQKIKP